MDIFAFQLTPTGWASSCLTQGQFYTALTVKMAADGGCRSIEGLPQTDAALWCTHQGSR